MHENDCSGATLADSAFDRDVIANFAGTRLDDFLG
jgi:hypothetical protein